MLVCVFFFLWALLSDFPARVRFTAGFLQDESDFLIEQPHGGLSVPSLMRITSNRWSLRARRKEELAGNACLLCVRRDGYLYSSSKTFFLHPVRKWNHQYDISWTVQVLYYKRSNSSRKPERCSVCWLMLLTTVWAGPWKRCFFPRLQFGRITNSKF